MRKPQPLCRDASGRCYGLTRFFARFADGRVLILVTTALQSLRGEVNGGAAPATEPKGAGDSSRFARAASFSTT